MREEKCLPDLQGHNLALQPTELRPQWRTAKPSMALEGVNAPAARVPGPC